MASQFSLLIVCATYTEIAPFIEKIRAKKKSSTLYTSTFGRFEIHCLISGVGGVATTYWLTQRLAEKKYDLAVNVGIAGTFSPDIAIGEVLNIYTDTFADLGMETSEGFCTLFDVSFLKPNEFPFSDGLLKANFEHTPLYKPLMELKTANGITVNTTSGTENTIKQRILKFNPATESMEGAAFFYVCLNRLQPCAQVRSISNLVEVRNIKNWNIPLAIQNLNNYFIHLLQLSA